MVPRLILTNYVNGNKKTPETNQFREFSHQLKLKITNLFYENKLVFPFIMLHLF